jgi:tRNA(Arg) A34 adenosine deaminase TadA
MGTSRDPEVGNAAGRKIGSVAATHGAARADDLAWLRRAIALSTDARAAGHHPFGALVVAADGTVLAEAMNAHTVDRTCHAEMNAVRSASAAHAPAALHDATLYSSAEPCAMCAGATYWSGIGRVVYGLSEARLLQSTGADPANPTLSLPCREVFARGQRPIEVVGPLLEDEALRAHAGFWTRGGAAD